MKTKVIFSVVFVGLLFVSSTKVRALENTTFYPGAKFTLTTDKTSAIADGKDAIKITFGAFWIKEDTGGYSLSTGASPSTPKPFCFLEYSGYTIPEFNTYQNGPFIYTESTGNTFNFDNKSLDSQSIGNGYHYRLKEHFSCTTGYVTVAFTSTKAEKKILYINESHLNTKNAYITEPLVLTFTAPTIKPITKTPSKTNVTKPSAPVVSKISNKDVAKNADGTFIPIIVRQGNPITFSGTTSANATVHLTIHSDPITADVKADADGNWLYTLDKEISLGDHTVDATVTDSTGQTSDSATIAQFILIEPITPVTVEPVETATFVMNPVTWGLSTLAVILIGAVGWIELKRRKAKL